MRKARSERERRFIERTHSGMAVFFGLSLIALVALPGKLKLFVLPILVVVGFGIRHGMRRGLARIQAADAADAFTRMKRVGPR